uniref:Ig-like domain-containing protein n=1 Tax=Oryzias melastigma TaxID=30732 RepID=A0A3B3CG21_ORYME
MMTSELLVFFLTCLFAGTNGQKMHHKSSSSVQQKGDFLSVSIGDAVTLECPQKGQTLKRIFWSKKSFGRKPELICSFYVHSTEVEFFGEFKNNQRFILDTENKNHHLKIFDIQFSDSATYNCIHSDSYILTFLENILLNSVILQTLVGLLTFLSVLVVFLLFLLWKINKRNNCISTGKQTYFTSKQIHSLNTENLHYAAINVKRSSRSRQKNGSNADCVYSSVIQQN